MQAMRSRCSFFARFLMLRASGSGLRLRPDSEERRVLLDPVGSLAPIGTPPPGLGTEASRT
eukprot:9498641-Pyramimonas_sp.AAC.3